MIALEDRIVTQGTLIIGPNGQYYELIKDLRFTDPKSSDFLKEHDGAPVAKTSGVTIPQWAALGLRRAFGVED